MATTPVQHHDAPFFSASPTDQSGILVMVSVVASTLSILAIAAKLFWRRNIYALKSYDYALLVSVVLLLGHTGLTISSAKLGVGKHRDDVGDQNLVLLRKTQYAASLLAISVAFCTKTAMVLFIESINTYTEIFYTNRVLLGLITSFFVSTLFANSFQCSLPSPWLAQSPASCPSAAPVYMFTLISSLITDASIFALAIWMILRVQTDFRTKSFVIFLFSFRLLCAASIIPALLSTDQLYNTPGNDYTWLSMPPSLWLSVNVNLSVITACIPSLKGLFDSWLGNTIGIDIDAPYQLQRTSGKHKFHATAYDLDGSNNNSNNSNNSSNQNRSKTRAGGGANNNTTSSNESHNGGGGGRKGSSPSTVLKLGPSTHNKVKIFSEGRDDSHVGGGVGDDQESNRSHGSEEDHESESVRRLTGGITVKEDVEIHFADRESRYQRSSMGSSHR